jgi:hypothetical protein
MHMTIAAHDLLNSFERLEETEKREVAVEILKRSALLDESPVGDEELIQIADQAFLELERRESENANATAR